MTQSLRRVAIVSPLRTAVGRFGGALRDVTAGQLGAVILKALVERSGIDPARVDDVVFAQGYGSGEALPSDAGHGWRRGCRWKCPAINLTVAADRACRPSSTRR